jgi:hypothetical protein
MMKSIMLSMQITSPEERYHAIESDIMVIAF